MRLAAVMQSRKFPFAAGFLICMGLWLLMSWVSSWQHSKQIAETKAAGLASISDSSVAWEPVSLYRQRSLFSPASFSPRVSRNVAMSVAFEADQDSVTKKIVRMVQMQITCEHPGDAADRMQAAAERLGGYVVRSARAGQPGEELNSGIELRVPAEYLDELRNEIRRIAKRVESEQVEARDVTKEFVDLQSRLRNLHAEETQYLQIMKQARSVKETLEVSEKLDETRGEIEKATGELKYLSHDVAMSAVKVEVRAEAETRVMGVHWRPWYSIRTSFRDGVQGIVNYADAMIAFLFWLPTMLIWLVTMGFGAWLSVRIGRKLWTMFKTA